MASLNRKRVSRRAQTLAAAVEKPTVWQALNEPVVEVSEQFAFRLLALSVLMLAVAWVGPYWRAASAEAPVITYNSPIIAPAEGQVAGAQISASPILYTVAVSLPMDFANAFTVAANQVLDVSPPIQQLVNFSTPGWEAVWNAWLFYMKDPYSTF